MKNTSISLNLEDKKQIDIFINSFYKKTGFKISIAEFVKSAIKEKLERLKNDRL